MRRAYAGLMPLKQEQESESGLLFNAADCDESR